MQHLTCIHQPDFLPWLGLFNKVLNCEKTIIFDSVPISMGKSWSTRVKILLNGKEHWITMPIRKKGLSGQKLCQVEMVEARRNWVKIIKTLKQAYRKSPYLEDTIEFLDGIGPADDELLADFCLRFIVQSADRMGFGGFNYVRSSDNESLMSSSLTKTDLIVETCKTFGVRQYLSGEGCLSFLEQEKFSDAGINLHFQGFKHPVYPQSNNHSAFVPGLSIIDSWMNVGFGNTKELLCQTLHHRNSAQAQPAEA